eukprot:TRINITY_DN3538_c0_g1_i1.p1 TRINITY_DN3538_c0_g1~~TRINITY_DN3538_c0_g1_i1.p1  ORF type:complete len:2558 (+),score=533.17 TRINITY_DN3538_c0_g1_i1:82-7674(+)
MAQGHVAAAHRVVGDAPSRQPPVSSQDGDSLPGDVEDDELRVWIAQYLQRIDLRALTWTGTYTGWAELCQWLRGLCAAEGAAVELLRVNFARCTRPPPTAPYASHWQPLGDALVPLSAGGDISISCQLNIGEHSPVDGRDPEQRRRSSAVAAEAEDEHLPGGELSLRGSAAELATDGVSTVPFEAGLRAVLPGGRLMEVHMLQSDVRATPLHCSVPLREMVPADLREQYGSGGAVSARFECLPPPYPDSLVIEGLVVSVTSERDPRRLLCRRLCLREVHRSLCYHFLGECVGDYNLLYGSCQVLGPRSVRRCGLIRLTDSQPYRNAVLVLIGINCFAMGWQAWDPGTYYKAGAWSTEATALDSACTLLFAVEVVLAALSRGLAAHRYAYLRDPWNALDCVVVITGLTEFVGGADLGVVRVLRVMRPLRTFKRVQGVAVVFETLVSSASRMFTVMVLLLFLIWVFAIVGVQLWGGEWHNHCWAFRDPCTNGSACSSELLPVLNDTRACSRVTDLGRQCGADSNGVALPQLCRAERSSARREWLNFDHIGNALLIVFAIISLDDWPQHMAIAQDLTGWFTWIYFVAVTLLGSFFCINLVVAVLLGGMRLAEGTTEYPAMACPQMPVGSNNVPTYPAAPLCAAVLHPALAFALPHADLLKTTAYHEGAIKPPASAIGMEEDYDEPTTPGTDVTTPVRDSEVADRLKADFVVQRAGWTRSSTDATALQHGLALEEAKGTVRHGGCLRPRGDLVQQQHLIRAIQDLATDEEFKDIIKRGLRRGAPARGKLRAAGMLFVLHPLFQGLVFLVTLINCAVLAADHYRIDPGLADKLDAVNYACSLVFICEAVLKVLSLGPRLYFTDGFNVFDFVLVAVSIPELLIGGRVSTFSVFRVLRMFRVLRAMRVVAAFRSMRRLVATVIHALASAGASAAILVILIFMFGTLGVQVFWDRETGGTLAGSDLSFASLGEAMLSCFVVCTGDGWGRGTAAAMATHEGWSGAIFFVVLWTFGGLVIGNLFVAVLIRSFVETHPCGADQRDEHVVRFRELLEQRLRSAGSSHLPVREMLAEWKWSSSLECGGGPRISAPTVAPAVLSRTGTERERRRRSTENLASGQTPQIDGQAGEERTEGEDADDGEGDTARDQGAMEPAPSQSAASPRSSSPAARRSPPSLSADEKLPPVQCELPAGSTEPFGATLLELFPGTQPAAVSPATVLSRQLASPPPPPPGLHDDSEVHTAVGGDEHPTMSAGEEVAQQFAATRRTRKRSMRNQMWNPDVLLLRLSKRFGADPAQAQGPEPDEHEPCVMLENTACCCLHPTSRLRVFVYQLVTAQRFKSCVLALITLNCLCIAVDSPRLRDRQPWAGSVLNITDYIFAVLFCVEVCLKVAAHSLCGSDTAYLSDTTNQLDLVVVLMSVAGLGAPTHGTFPWREFRSLRVLRIVLMLKEARISFVAVVRAIPQMFNVTAIAFTLVLIFAILGVQLMMGLFHRCSDPSITAMDACRGQWTTNVTVGLQWQSVTAERRLSNDASFDNVARALWSLLIIAFGDDWTAIMFSGIDVGGLGEIASPGARRGASRVPFFVAYVIVGQFFLLNLFVGVLIDQYHSIRGESAGTATLTERQRMWVRAQHMLLQSRLEPSFGQPVGARLLFWDVVTSPYFDHCVSALIVVNSVLLSLHHYAMGDTKGAVLKWGNLACVILFTLEAIVKIIARGLRGYFHFAWNRFDFVIVLCSWVGYFVSGGFGALRVFRIARLLRVATYLEGVDGLLRTLVSSFPAALNIGAVLLCVFFIFGAFGVSVFGRVARSDLMTEWTNFDTMAHAVVTLWQVATAQNWHNMADELSQTAPPACSPARNDCGRPLAGLYFALFVVCSNLICLNLLVCAVLDHFADITEGLDLRMHCGVLRTFRTAWLAVDPQATRLLRVSAYTQLAQVLPHPLYTPERPGGGGECTSCRCKCTLWTHVLFQLRRAHVPISRSHEVRYEDALAALACRVFDITPEGAFAVTRAMGRTAPRDFYPYEFAVHHWFAARRIVAAFRYAIANRGERGARLEASQAQLRVRDLELARQEEQEYLRQMQEHMELSQRHIKGLEQAFAESVMSGTEPHWVLSPQQLVYQSGPTSLAASPIRGLAVCAHADPTAAPQGAAPDSAAQPQGAAADPDRVEVPDVPSEAFESASPWGSSPTPPRQPQEQPAASPELALSSTPEASLVSTAASPQATESTAASGSGRGQSAPGPGTAAAPRPSPPLLPPRWSPAAQTTSAGSAPPETVSSLSPEQHSPVSPSPHPSPPPPPVVRQGRRFGDSRQGVLVPQQPQQPPQPQQPRVRPPQSAGLSAWQPSPRCGSSGASSQDDDVVSLQGKLDDRFTAAFPAVAGPGRIDWETAPQARGRSSGSGSGGSLCWPHISPHPSAAPRPGAGRWWAPPPAVHCPAASATRDVPSSVREADVVLLDGMLSPVTLADQAQLPTPERRGGPPRDAYRTAAASAAAAGCDPAQGLLSAPSWPAPRQQQMQQQQPRAQAVARRAPRPAAWPRRGPSEG